MRPLLLVLLLTLALAACDQAAPPPTLMPEYSLDALAEFMHAQATAEAASPD